MSLLPLVLLAAAPTQARPPGKPGLWVSCEASLAFIKDFVSRSDGRKLVFTSEDDAERGNLTGQHWTQRSARHERTTEPPRSLIKKLEREGGLNSVSRCAQIRVFLDSRHIAYGPDAVEQAQKQGKDFTYRAEIVSVSLAVVSADRKIALLSSRAGSAPLAASGAIHQLDRDGSSHWRITKSAVVWIS